MSNGITYSGELRRKIIHLSSSIFALFLIVYGWNNIITPMVIFTFFFIILDYIRIYNLSINKIYKLIFDDVTRNKEQNKLTGASYVLIGITLTILLFDENAAVNGILYLSFGDTSAALIGRKYGKTFIGNKTLEWSFAFFITCLIVSNLLTPTSLIVAIIASCFATLIELKNIYNLNDNLTIPICTAFVVDTLSGIV